MMKKVYVLVVKDGKETPIDVYHDRDRAEEEGYKQPHPFYVKEFGVKL